MMWHAEGEKSLGEREGGVTGSVLSAATMVLHGLVGGQRVRVTWVIGDDDGM